MIQLSEGGEEFLTAYYARFGSYPGAYDPLAYDTIMLLAHAIESAGSTEFTAVRDAIQAISFQGLSGLISFTPQRELLNSNFMLLEIRDNQYTLFRR
jgi:branched-chain amino acid transport system substrate-binding protein